MIHKMEENTLHDGHTRTRHRSQAQKRNVQGLAAMPHAVPFAKQVQKYLDSRLENRVGIPTLGIQVPSKVFEPCRRLHKSVEHITLSKGQWISLYTITVDLSIYLSIYLSICTATL